MARRISERHPPCLGVYEGTMGRKDVQHYVESSDCVILPGVFMTDINLGIYTARLDPARSINATIVITDAGDAPFVAANLFIHKRTEFLGPTYCASMESAMPAAIGAEVANPRLRRSCWWVMARFR